jgi:hypothetical protein
MLCNVTGIAIPHNVFINFFPKIAYFSQKLYYCEVCIYYFG